MKSTISASSLIFMLQIAALGAIPYHALVHFTDIPAGARPSKLVAGPGGTLFIISTASFSGLPHIHVQKTDQAGNTLAASDFGGSNIGAGLGDSVSGAVVDPKGNLVIVGQTSSPDFPLVAPLITAAQGNSAFVIKFDPQLKNILFSTRLGGTQGGTAGGGVAVDSAGNVYVSGLTSDTDFPVTSGAFQKTPPPNNSSNRAGYAFLTEISADSKTILSST